jgi:hypothetical protein
MQASACMSRRSIQTGGSRRSPGVGYFAREQQQWVVQPLIDAGLELGQIAELVFRLAFQDIVSEGRDTVASLPGLVADRSAEVRTAWAQTIARLLLLESTS